MSEEDFYKRLKDCWVGKTYKGVLSRYYQAIGAVATDQPTAWWANKIGSYILKIEKDDGERITYTSYIAFESGHRRVHSRCRNTNKIYIKDEISQGHLVEIKE